MATKKELRRERIKRGIRSKISGTGVRPRLSIFRSNNEIYAQIIDDIKGNTLASASSSELKELKGPKVDISRSVGQKLAEKAVTKGISEVVFDRGGYLYHGRIKALAEGAREGGLKF
jgi:large subunit ribosomal protein L18